MNILLLFYITGYIVAFATATVWDRIATRKSDDYSWADVRNHVFMALLSWIIVLIVCIVLIYKILSKAMPAKPPKWL